MSVSGEYVNRVRYNIQQYIPLAYTPRAHNNSATSNKLFIVQTQYRIITAQSVRTKNLDSIVENCSVAWLDEFDSRLELCVELNKCFWVQKLSVYIWDEEWTTHWNKQHDRTYAGRYKFRDSVAKCLVLWVFRIETYSRKWSINQERLGQILTGKKHNKHMDILIPTFIPYRGKHVRSIIQNNRHRNGLWWPWPWQWLAYSGIHVWSENSTTSKPQHNTPGAHSHVGDGRKHISTVNGWTFDAV